MMARMRPVIHTRKEIVDSTLLGVTAATNSTISVASVVNDYVGTAGTVETGSVIKWIYLFVQILETATTNNVDFYIIKRPSGTVNPVPGAVGGVTARKFVLHEEKGIPGNSNDGAYPLTFKGVIKIPKGRQRMGEGDVIQVIARGVGVYNMCLKCIYKVQM